MLISWNCKYGKIEYQEDWTPDIYKITGYPDHAIIFMKSGSKVYVDYKIRYLTKENQGHVK
jgi:hypothetical protein